MKTIKSNESEAKRMRKVNDKQAWIAYRLRCMNSLSGLTAKGEIKNMQKRIAEYTRTINLLK